MLAPALAAAAILVLLPVLDTLWLSLHDVVLYRPRSRPFIGLANYARALTDPVFWESLGNSLVWVICAVSLQFTLGFATALLLNRSFAWRGIARALVVVPWALPSVIIGLIWTWMLDFNLGVLNNIGVHAGHPAALRAVAGAVEHRDGGRDPRRGLAGLSVLRGDVAGRAAGDPRRTLRGGLDRWRRRVGQVPSTSRCPVSPASSPPRCCCA